MNITLPRRDWLKVVASSAGGVLLVKQGTGCSYYSAEKGDAYAPWNFPDGESQPEMVSAARCNPCREPSQQSAVAAPCDGVRY